MKEFLSPKIVTIVFCVIAGIGIINTQTTSDTLVVVSLIVGAWMAITIHEIGHVIFGKIAGYEFLNLITGPFLLEKTERGIKLLENKSWLSFGGLSVMMPSINEKKRMIKNSFIYTVGGPFSSLFLCLLSLFLSYELDNIYLKYFACINGGILIATMIPFKDSMGMGSDGHVLLSLLRKDGDALRQVENMIINKELFSNKVPSNWDPEYIKIAKQKEPSLENIFSGQMIYFYEVETSGFYTAREAVLGYTSIHVNKQNSIRLIPFLHMQQIATFLSDNCKMDEITYYQQYLWGEPVSFNRGNAMIAYLENDIPKALEYLHKAKKVIEAGEHRYGFFKSERTLTALIEKKIVKIQTEEDIHLV